MGKRMCIAAMAAAWAMLGASAMQVFAADKVPASAPVSGPASSAGGYFRSDRTMEDIKEAEAALKEQWQKDSKAAGSRFKGGGTWTDLNGYAWKYGLTLPAKVEAGAKYPLFIGNCGWALAMPSSQEKFPCYILNVYMPEALFKPKPGGFDAPSDYKTVTASAIKEVVDKVLAENPSADASRVYIEGASKFGALALISAYNYPDTYAAAVPSVGGLDISKALLIGKRKIGLWLFYGVLDGGEVDAALQKAPHGRTGPHIYKALRDAGYDCMMTVYTHGDHHEYGFSDSLKNPDWNDFTRLRKWLFEQKKPAATWPVINSPTTALATVGKPFTYTIGAGNEPRSFSAVRIIEHAEAADGTIAKPEPELPKGLTVDPKTGILSGTPEVAGRFFIRLIAAGDKGDGLTTLALTVKEK